MQPTTRLPLVLALLHLVIGLTHAAAHQQLGIFGSPAQIAYVTLVIYLAPLLALVLLVRRSRAGSGLLLASLAGSLVYGVYFHFIADTHDHVGHLPSVAWAPTFAISAMALALCDAVGTLLLARVRMRQTVIAPGGRHIILVDGECVFCNRLVVNIMRLDKHGVFHFAHIQGTYAQGILAKYGRDPRDVDPIYLLANAGSDQEVLLLDGAAGREIWPRLLRGGAVMRLFPLALLDLSYVTFARVRYRLIGRYDTCYVPSGEERARYLE